MAKKTRPRRPVKKTRKAAPRKSVRKAHPSVADPFRIDSKHVPPGKAYQWHPWAWADQESMRAQGWSAVPFDRHPKIFDPRDRAPGGWIKVQGLTLIENSAVWVQAELDRVARSAQEIGDQHKAKYGQFGRFFIMPEEWVETKVLDGAPPEIGPPIDVPLSLLIRVPAHWAAAAAYLNLTLTEYARRRVVGERLVLGCMEDRMDRSLEAVYEPVNLSFSPQRYLS